MKCLRYKSPASEKEFGSSVAYFLTNAGFNSLLSKIFSVIYNRRSNRSPYTPHLKRIKRLLPIPFQTREYIFPINKTPPAQNAHRGSGREMPTAAAVAECTPRQRSRNAHRGSGRGMHTAAAVGRKTFREGRAFCQRKEIYAMSLVVDRLLFRKQNLLLFFSAEQIID